MQTVDAIYEEGILRPVRPLEGIAERTRVRLTIHEGEGSHSLDACIGSMPDEDAAEVSRIINEEFERVNPDEWR